MNSFEVDQKFARLRGLEVPALEKQRQIHQGDHHRYFDQGTDHCRKAAPELMPNTETATAIASSKLFEAAVKASVVVLE